MPANNVAKKREKAKIKMSQYGEQNFRKLGYLHVKKIWNLEGINFTSQFIILA